MRRLHWTGAIVGLGLFAAPGLFSAQPAEVASKLAVKDVERAADFYISRLGMVRGKVYADHQLGLEFPGGGVSHPDHRLPRHLRRCGPQAGQSDAGRQCWQGRLPCRDSLAGDRPSRPGQGRREPEGGELSVHDQDGPGRGSLISAFLCSTDGNLIELTAR